MKHAAAQLCVMTHFRDPDRPRLAVDGGYLCRGHVEELRQTVAEMPARYDDLDRAHGPGQASRGSGYDRGLFIDDQAAAHRSHMAGVLASWCRAVAEDRGITPPYAPDIYATAPWLTLHIDWCACQPWVAEMLAELREVTRRALGLADIPARRVDLGEQCLVHADGERCEGTITIVVRGDDWTAHCTMCDQPQEATQYLRQARKAATWITTEEVIRLAQVYGLPCSEEVVWQWHHRRRIEGQRVGRQTVYGLRSVQRYLAQRTAPRVA